MQWFVDIWRSPLEDIFHNHLEAPAYILVYMTISNDVRREIVPGELLRSFAE